MHDRGLSAIARLACHVCMKLMAQSGRMMLVKTIAAAHMMILLHGTLIVCLN
jgi:hypothetical protein